MSTKSEHPIVNERRKVREKPYPHFRRVAKMWSAIIGSPISPEQVLLCMAALKMAREAGSHEADNIPDAIGYLSMMDEVKDFDNRMEAGGGDPLRGCIAGVSEEAKFRPVPPGIVPQNPRGA